MDTIVRSLVKSITWRVLGVILLGIIVYAVTGDFKKMTIINILFHGIQIILYYFHERIWEKTSWGKNIHPLSCLPVKGNLTKKDLKIITNKLKELGCI